MLEMELVFETLEFINHMKWLCVQENFIEFCPHENFKT
jgi:hypothetical protein